MCAPSVSCGHPTPPPRGSLGDLTSLQQGAEVTFQCNPRLVPLQQMISVCMANRSWTPDPAEFVCRGKPRGIVQVTLHQVLHIFSLTGNG